MKFWFGAAAAATLAAVLATAAGGALAHDDMGPIPDTPAAHAAAARHQNFKQLGGAFKAILDEVKKDAPDKAVLAANAQKMHALASQEASWFPTGSGAESGVKTAAKPDIWRDQAGFAAAIQRLQAETGKLQQFATAGDLVATKGQLGATGGACKNCHDKYRVPDKT